jgi:hypothetical protein
MRSGRKWGAIAVGLTALVAACQGAPATPSALPTDSAAEANLPGQIGVSLKTVDHVAVAGATPAPTPTPTHTPTPSPTHS